MELHRDVVDVEFTSNFLDEMMDSLQSISERPKVFDFALGVINIISRGLTKPVGSNGDQIREAKLEMEERTRRVLEGRYELLLQRCRSGEIKNEDVYTDEEIEELTKKGELPKDPVGLADSIVDLIDRRLRFAMVSFLPQFAAQPYNKEN